MKVQLKAASYEEARKLISELPAEEYNEGDKAEVTFPDGSKHFYVFRATWRKQEF